MYSYTHQNNRKYFWMEFGFLFFLSFVVTIISDLEYSAYEEHNISNFANDIGYRIVTEFLEMVPYAIYYWGFLKRYVFKRNITGIILSTVGFVIFDHVFDKYVINWAVAHAGFISESLRKRALEDLLRPGIKFTFNHLLVSSVFPIIGLAFLIRSLTQETQVKALKEQQLSSELNYLKAQIHPHFFFNTINNIYSLALKQSADTAPMVARLGEMMRYILYEADQQTVPITREIAFLSSYIEVEKMRHPHNIDIKFDTQGISPGYQIEPLMLLPFIENAFKHGLEQETGTGYVNIIICQTENELMLDVSNSKPQQQAQQTSPGIGLKNVLKRLNILYPEKHRLDVKDNTSSYQAVLTLQTV